MSCSIEIPFKKIILYIDDSIEHVEPKNLKDFLETKMAKSVELKSDYLRSKFEKGLPKKIAGAKVRNKRERKRKEPLPKEIDIEKKIIKGEKELLGIIYDAHELNKVMREMLSEREREEHTVIITKRLMATLEKHESRYHVRAVLNSIPSIVSVSGIVEGPAKPRRYYLTDEPESEDILDFKPMEHDDERMESAVKSYLLQTVFWRSEGDPFCESEGCRLYNSHWQREVIEDQVNGKLCEKHKRKLEKFKKNGLDEKIKG